MTFSQLSEFNELHIMQDKKIDFFSIICLQRFGRGPALGGCRFVEYESKEQAIADAVRLSNAMSYKAAVSGLPHDGGKAILVRPKKLIDRILLLKTFAQFVDSLGGKYITTVDSGTDPADMSIIKRYTPFVTGDLEEATSVENNPSSSTALGLLNGLRCIARLLLGRPNLKNVHVAIQGAGNVGYRLAKLLHEDGAKLTICDLNPAAAKRCVNEFKATEVAHNEIYDIDCDIFSPCGLGQIINPETVKRFKAKVIAGAANDQLMDVELVNHLADRGIIYFPDFVINAGGLIHLSLQLRGKVPSFIQQQVINIAERVRTLIKQAELRAMTLHAVAQEMAEDELAI